MAKIPFTKLQLKKINESKEFTYNEQIITVKQYLPIADKLALIGRVINAASDEYNFANPVKLDMYLSLEIVFTYTNLSFTDKQKEDIGKLYDLLEENDIFDKVIELLPEQEYTTLWEGVVELADNIYAYQTSVLGILDAVGRDYKDLDLDAQKIQQELNDPNNMALLKSVLTKLG
jgi:hypothetical protein